jgi:flagellar biosynthetic protein FliR/FlhB
MQDKTEKATPKKKRDERKKGNVAKSREVVNTVTFSGVVISAFVFIDLLLAEFKKFISRFLSVDYILSDITSQVGGKRIFNDVFTTFYTLFIPFALVIIILGVIGNVAQTGFLLTGEPLKPKLSKLNPVNGLKNMFSLRSLGVMIKNIAIVIFLGTISFSFVKGNISSLINTGNVYLPYLPEALSSIITKLLIQILLGLIIISIFDYGYQMYTYDKQMRMSKQEIKDEYKQQEGDPQVKARIKQKQRQIATSRMMKAVPEATVIITNPTHISIALRYEEGKDSAPIVVAKGADNVAFKIREIAKAHNIPIIENKPVARALYKHVDIDKEIPIDFYEVVAQILTAVYKMKRKQSYKR